MTAQEAIKSIHEKKRLAPNWTDTKGLFADLSGFPDVQYYVKCPKCGSVHGSYKTMREAHAQRLCGVCNVDAINKLKKAVKEVDDPKNRGKPGKSTSKMFNEADEHLPPPPEPGGFDPREYVMSTPYTGNWIEVAMHELGVEQGGIGFSPARHEHQDIEDAEDNFKYDLEGSDGTEWRIFRSEDDAKSYTLDQVREQLEQEPGNFNQDWLKGYVNMARLKDYLSDSANDIEWLLDMDFQKQVDYLIKHGGYLEEEDFYTPTGKFRKVTKRTQALYDQAIEAFKAKQVEEFDPIDYLEGIYGKDEVMGEAIKLVGIDVGAAAQNAIDTDGWVHFANTYDDNSIDLQSGAVAVRTN